MKNAKEQEAYKEAIKNDFFAYNYHVHNEGCTVGNERWFPTKFHKWLCETVQAFIEEDTGNAFDIMLLSTGPQHGKSETITETLPSWYLGLHPEHKVIEASYNADFATKFGRRNKEKIERYGELFGIELSKSTKSATEWELSNGIGGMKSFGMSSGITGNGAHLMIIDDPIKNAKDVASPGFRDDIWEVWLSSCLTRQANGAKIIVIQTRWHEDDLYGRILASGQKCTHYNIPIEAEENDILGREVGEPLCPEFKDAKWLKSFKESFLAGSSEVDGMCGVRAWNALFQGRPTAKEGNIIKREWWKFYNHGTVPFEHLIMSVDAAFKDNAKNDYVAIEVWGKYGTGMYLVDLINEHLDFPKTIDAIIQTKQKYPKITGILIEDKANGSAIISTLQHRMFGIIGIDPRGGKEARVNSITDLIEAGNVYVPRDKNFAGEFIDQCAEFPNGKHDDMVDGCSMALERLRYRPGTYKLEEKPRSAFNITKQNAKIGRGEKRWSI